MSRKAISQRQIMQTSPNHAFLKEFTLFPQLAPEIQLHIFSLAIPSPLEIYGVIPLFIGRNLSQPRALLPSVHDIKTAYKHCAPSEEVLDDFDHEGDWSLDNQHMSDDRKEILSLMWACSLSRLATREVYRLDIDSLVAKEKEERNWWSEGRRVFFPPLRREGQLTFHLESQTLLFWLLGQMHQRGNFKDLEHITLFLNSTLNDLFKDLSDDERFDVDLDHGLLSSENLKSVTLLVDPGRMRLAGWDKRKLVYWEVEETRIHELKSTPRTYCQWLKNEVLDKRDGGEPPQVEVSLFAMGLGKWRKADAYDD